MATAYDTPLLDCQTAADELRAVVFAADALVHELPNQGTDETGDGNNRLAGLLSVCTDLSSRLTASLTELERHMNAPNKEG